METGGVWVKICGVRTIEQARWAARCGADAIGLNLHPPSPRSIAPELAAEIAASVQLPSILVVVDRPLEELRALVARIRPAMVQLHGDEPPGFDDALGAPTLRAFRARPGALDAIRASGRRRFLLDAFERGRHGGTGRRVAPETARAANALGELILAGGLTPENVSDAVAALRPWGVDVASGVERAPGQQDPQRVAAFIQRAKGALQEQP